MKMLGTRYRPVGTRFSLILGTGFSILGTRIGSLKHLKKTWLYSSTERIETNNSQYQPRVKITKQHRTLEVNQFSFIIHSLYSSLYSLRCHQWPAAPILLVCAVGHAAASVANAALMAS